MICHVPPCNGSGWLLAKRNGRFEWWPCPACGGSGVTVQYGPSKVSARAIAALIREKAGDKT